MENVGERMPVASTKYSVGSFTLSRRTSKPPSIARSMLRRWKDCSDSPFMKIDASADSKPPSAAVTIWSVPRAMVTSPGCTATEYGFTSAASVAGRSSAPRP